MSLTKLGSVVNQSASGNSGKNLLINGNFDIWQRGTSFSSTGYYADRWKSYNLSGATYTFTRQLETTAIQQAFYGKLDITAGSSASRGIEQRIEEVVTAAGETVTLSFWAKTDTARTLEINIIQNFGSGGSSTVTITNDDITTTTSWASYSITVELGSTANKTIGGNSYLSVAIKMKNITTGTLNLGQVQLEVGNTATDFEYRGLPEELALCQRYFEKSYSWGQDPGSVSSLGMAWQYMNVTSAIIQSSGSSEKFKVSKRTAPTITMYSNNTGTSGKAYDWASTEDIDVVSAGKGTEGFYWYCNNYATTANQSVSIAWTADAEL